MPKKTMSSKPKSKSPSEEYARFEKLAKQLIAVPKSEIDKRQAEYEKKRAAKKRKAAA
jgi:multidrug resistance efflux pump